MPALSSCSRDSWERTEGPRVQTILARRIFATEGACRGLSAQEQRQVLSLPTQRGFVLRERALACPESRRVMDAPVFGHGRRPHLVEHLVEHDELDEIARHVRPVE